MNDNRLQVLQMLADGEVSAEEADRLIAALDKQPAAPPARAAEVTTGNPRYLRIFVEEQESGKDSPTKGNDPCNLCTSPRKSQRTVSSNATSSWARSPACSGRRQQAPIERPWC